MSARIRSLDDFLALLKGIKQARDGQYKALCPAHNDRDPSLSISLKDSRILLRCMAGCQTEDVVKVLGLTMGDLFLQGKSPTPKRETVAVYPYRNRKGEVIYETVRYKPKAFKQRRPDGKGGYIWNLKGVHLVPYRLPELVGAVAANRTIFGVEGEKDADNVHNTLGFDATCNPLGAGKWRDSYSKYLIGADVVIIADKDEPGRAHAQSVAQSLHGKAASIKVVELPGENVKDTSDWIEVGGTKDEIEKIIDEAPEWQPVSETKAPKSTISSAPTFNLTDSGNAERFAAQFGDIVRYVKEWKQFIIYNGRVWEADISGAQTLGLTKLVARSIYQEAANEPDDTKREELAKYAKASESEQRRQAMAKCLISEPGIEISQGDLDKDPFLLNCQNGTIDLRTGGLRPHDKSDLITQIVPIPYKPGTKSALWAKFLQQVFANREDVIGYVQRAIGYSATADQCEQALFFSHGGGWNGKSTFLGAIMDTLGPDYAGEIDPGVLMVRKFASSGPDEAAAMFYKKRFVKSTETEEGQRLSVGLMKRMTGGEDLTCNRKYQHAFNHHPTHKLWLSGNHEPVITDTTDSIWFRLKKIPFTVTFKPEQRNKNLPNQLAQERGAILAWIVEGCLAWQEEGLKEPEEITKATKQYREDQDVLADFLKECCEFQTSATVTVAELHKTYKQWCADNDAYPLAKKTFNSRLQEKGLRKASGGGNKTTWYGIGLSTWHLLAQHEVKSEPEKTKTDSESVKKVNFVNENSGNSKAPSREGGFLGNSLTKLTKLTTDRREVALGMPVSRMLEIWRAAGAPIVHLGLGENCEKLDLLLSNPNVLDRHLEAVRQWIEKRTDKLGELGQ